MPKKIVIFGSALLLLVPVLAITVLLVAAGSAGGTQWLLARAQQLAGDGLGWERSEGTLLDSLVLRGVRLEQPGLALRVDALELAWRPAALGRGLLDVQRLTADGVTVVLSATEETPPSDAPFDPATLDPPLDIELSDLSLRDINLELADGTRQRIQRVHLSARVLGIRLEVRDFSVSAAQGGLSASGYVGLQDSLPLALGLDWQWQLPDGRQGAGSLVLEGSAEALAVQHRGAGDLPVELGGEIRSLLGEPAWDLVLDWPALVVTPGEPLRVGPGRLATRGTLAEYSLSSEGQASGEGFEPARWQLEATGDAGSIRLAPLRLHSEPYHLQVAGPIDWRGPIAADLSFEGLAGGLAELNPELPDRLTPAGVLQVRFEGETLTLQALDLAFAEAALGLSLEGSVRLPADAEPLIDARLDWHHLQWPLQGESLAGSPRGEARLTGSPDDWQLVLDAAAAGSQLPPGHWQARASGDTRGLRLEPLHGELLDGELRMAGEVAWLPEPRWQLDVEGRDLNPGAWQGNPAGSLGLQLATRGRVDPATGPDAAIELQALAGTLAGRDFTVRADASVAGEQYTLASLALDSGGNRLQASGTLAGEDLDLQWQLDAPSVATLQPGTGGRLDGRGRVSGTLSAPAVDATLQGRDLAFEGNVLAALDLALSAGLQASAPLSLDLQLGELSQEGEPVLHAASLRGDGTTAAHNLALDVRAAAGELAATLDGGLDDTAGGAPGWQGMLSALRFSTAMTGPWSLRSAAPLALAPSAVQLGEACLQDTAAPPANVCVGADWAPQAGSAAVLSVARLDLSRWLPSLSGELDGELRGALASDGALSADGRFAVSEGDIVVETTEGTQRVAHGGGSLTLAINRAGLVASLDFRPLDSGSMRGDIRLPQLQRLPVGEPQALEGRLTLDLPDLSGLQGWVPQLANVQGRLAGDLTLAGDLQQPLVRGDLSLSEAQADVPVAGLELRQLALHLRDEPGQPGWLRIDGGLVSGGGPLTIAGRLAPALPAVDLTITGKKVEVYDTADAQAFISPDLQLSFSDALLRLRGRVEVPEARITPQLGVSPAASAADPSVPEEATLAAPTLIAPSGDVVIVAGREQVAPASPTPALPFRLDSEVVLALGKKVRVNALGFAGRIAGGLTFRNRPEQPALVPVADGRVSVEGGTFRAFGQDLQIENGEAIFRRVPVTEPEVNLRAVRWIDNDPLVSAAGVQVSGSLATPTMELFSRPQLDPVEIQSYLITGSSASSRDAALGFGTYLHPKLYVGYGFNLLEETSEFDALYTITPRYGVEATVGEADNNLGVTITYER